ARGAESQRAGRALCRHRHRLDAPRARRDAAPAREAARVQHRARHHRPLGREEHRAGDAGDLCGRCGAGRRRRSWPTGERRRARGPGRADGAPRERDAGGRAAAPTLRVKPLARDGDDVAAGVALAQVVGDIGGILKAERTALNFLQHLSGVATLTRRFVDAVAGTGATILDTRKTTPGLRFLEKYAVKCGGGENHRLALWDMYLVKDNHIRAAGGVTAAIDRISRTRQGDLLLEVEVESLDQLEEALRPDVDRILIDNRTLEEV